MESEIEYFDPQKRGNEWFEGREKGWLVVSRRNFQKVKVGDYGVFRAGGAEVGGTIQFIERSVHPAMWGRYCRVTFKTDNGLVFTEMSFNLLAVKLREGL